MKWCPKMYVQFHTHPNNGAKSQMNTYKTDGTQEQVKINETKNFPYQRDLKGVRKGGLSFTLILSTVQKDRQTHRKPTELKRMLGKMEET